MASAETITREMRAADSLPPDEREHRLNVLAIMYGADAQAILRDQAEAIDASPNVVRLADAAAKLPRGL